MPYRKGEYIIVLGWVHLMISYCGRVAIWVKLEYRLLRVFILISQTNKQNSERKEERKKETKTGWVKM